MKKYRRPGLVCFFGKGLKISLIFKVDLRNSPNKPIVQNNPFATANSHKITSGPFLIGLKAFPKDVNTHT